MNRFFRLVLVIVGMIFVVKMLDPLFAPQHTIESRPKPAIYTSRVVSPVGKPALDWEGYNRMPQDSLQRLGWMLHFHPEPVARAMLDRINDQQLVVSPGNCSEANASFIDAALVEGASVWQPVLSLCEELFTNVRDLNELLYRMSILFHEAIHADEYFAGGKRSQDLPMTNDGPIPATDQDCRDLFEAEVRAYYNQCDLMARWGMTLSFIDCSSQQGLQKSFTAAIARRPNSKQQNCLPVFRVMAGTP